MKSEENCTMMMKLLKVHYMMVIGAGIVNLDKGRYVGNVVIANF